MLPLRGRAQRGVHRGHLFAGGPGAAGRSFSDFGTIIQDRYLTRH
jgi:hypothetical protein